MKRDIPSLSFVESKITVVKKMRNAVRIVFAQAHESAWGKKWARCQSSRKGFRPCQKGDRGNPNEQPSKFPFTGLHKFHQILRLCLGFVSSAEGLT